MIDELERIGLTKGEAKVYLSLFDLGEGTKYPIADQAKVSASKVYEILDRLISKGLVSYVTKNNVKRYYPANPDKLGQYLSQKKEEITKSENILKSILPNLRARSASLGSVLSVKVYEGYGGIKSILDEVGSTLSMNHPWYAMGIRSSKKEVYNNLWVRFHKDRAKKKVECRLLFTDKDTDFYRALVCLPYTDLRVISQITPSGVAVYKEKVMIFTYAGSESACILIDDKGTAESFRQFFDGLWGLARR